MTDNAFTVSCEAIDDSGTFRLPFTGRGEDISPQFTIDGASGQTVSFAVTLMDLSLPVFGTLPHWVMWNVPVSSVIPRGIRPGSQVRALGAVQGIAYGWHRYRGPRPPIGTSHTYVFTILALDRTLGIPAFSGVSALHRAARRHVLHMAVVTGTFE